ncbi:hypothetical protein [Pseudomonas sp. NPDC089396]|uniref:hypothetical protein n=1 Tax=Pseudomonas sp. NPDC089396 TaxID=3364461 RepID=UPI0038371635
MADHSKEALLKRLAEGSVLHGWGAIVATDRARLNLLLRDQFLQGLADLKLMEPYTGTFAIEEGDQVRVTLRNLVLGPPQLSFEKAVLGSADVSTRMSLIAGEYTLELHPPGEPPIVKEAFTLREDMGFTLDAEVTLSVRMSDTGQRATVNLELANGRDFSCGLGSTAVARSLIGAQLKESIIGQSSYRRSYTLGAFDLEDYGPLSPRHLAVMTQAAPWSAEAGPDRQGDGCMALFMQLGINQRSGTLPVPNSDFPYLLPDEGQSLAEGISGTLVVDSFIKQLDCNEADKALAPWRLPNSRAYKRHANEEYQPKDIVVFGQIAATTATFEVDPPIVQVTAGEQQQFKLVGDGNVGSWSARNISLPLAVGPISDAGAYQVKTENQFAQDQQLVVVTGQIGQDEQGLRRAALVVESSQAVQIAPRIVAWAKGLPPIELNTANSDANPLTWSLVDSLQGSSGAKVRTGATQAAATQAPLGELVDLGNGRARFTPYPPDKTDPQILIQLIRATDRVTGAYGETSVIIIAYPQYLSVEPYHVPKLSSAEPVQFARKTPGDQNADAVYTWYVVGEGIIDNSGKFTPPAEPSRPASVVILNRDDEDVGYAIVEFAKHAPSSVSAARWKDLSVFGIEVLGSTECFANGLQQIALRITIETATLDDGEHPPISDVELASLRLFSVGTNAEVRFLEPDEEGLLIPDDITQGDWATNLAKNRFDPPGRFAQASAVAPRQSSPGTRVKDLYVQTTYRGVQKFRAEFQNETTKRWFNSEAYDPGAGAKVVDLKGNPPANYSIERYQFERDRVSDDGGTVEGDEFSYVDRSLDYWRLPYVRKLDESVMKFSMLRLTVDSNVSTIKWESEHFNETYFSYTGMAFYPNYRDNLKPTEMTFDGQLCRLASQQKAKLDNGLDQSKPPAQGELLFGLYRVPNFNFWHDGQGNEDQRYRELLDRPVEFELVDQEGNPHKLRVAFQTSGEGARNTLVLSMR